MDNPETLATLGTR